MTINVLKSARRITYILIGLWIAGVLYAVYSTPPAIKGYFEILAPDAAPQAVDADTFLHDPCFPAGRSAVTSYTTAQGVLAELILCFRPMEQEDGEKLVPYKVEDGKFWGNTPYSPEVDRYIAGALAGLKLKPADEQTLDAMLEPARWQQAQAAVLWSVGGAVFLVALASVLGWIVRGFMGIPMGHDRRPGKPPGTN